MKKFNLQEWLEFHKFASNLYAYPYDEQLQIYNINRNATAVAPFEVWSNIGLRINGGTRSMTIYDKNGIKKHLFDVSQTNGKDIKPWKYNVSYNEYIFDMLDKMYEKNGSETRADRGEKTFHNNIYDYVFESVYSHPKSPTGQLSTELCELIAETVTYTVCERLNVIEEQYKYDFSNFPVFDENAQELVGIVAAVYVNAFCRTAKQLVKTVSLEEAQGRQAMRKPIVNDDISEFEQKVTVEETTVTDNADIETENDISEKEDDRYVVEPDDTVEPEPDYNEFVEVPEKAERLTLTAEQQETVLKQIFQADYKKVNKQAVIKFYNINKSAKVLMRYTYAVYKGSHPIELAEMPDVVKWSATSKGVVFADANGAELYCVNWRTACGYVKQLIRDNEYAISNTIEATSEKEEKETEKYRGNIISASTMKQQRLYSKFVELFPDFLTDYKYLKLESNLGFMTLSLDKIGSNSVAMAHYYEQNGDLMVDPDELFSADIKPADGWLTADEYLSGNVVEKLRKAKLLSSRFPELKVNVEALEKVQPEKIKAVDILAQIGSSWIPEKYIEQFVEEVFGIGTVVEHNTATANWKLSNKVNGNYHSSTSTEYGTADINAMYILENSLNLRDSTVWRDKRDELGHLVYDDKGNKVREKDVEKTIAANHKAEKIKETFKEWVWTDAYRTQDLENIYNAKYNTERARTYDGSHLFFAGMTSSIELADHQKNAVARVLYGGNTLLAHVVGAGKTFEMTAAAMEMRRIGAANKPLFIVPNHLIGQWGKEFLTLYPDANILLATSEDFEKSRRKAFVNRIATGDYDAVIMGYSTFAKISISPEKRKEYYQQQIDELIDIIQSSDDDDNLSVKDAQKKKKQLETRLKNLEFDTEQDDNIFFENLGVDALFVDEAHNFKNLSINTKLSRIAGIQTTESKRSEDLLLKIQYIKEKQNGLDRGIVFATGTPISNSLTEMYVMKKYLEPDYLREKGLQHFDSWVADFAEVTTNIELSPTGNSWRAKKRCSTFKNLPELMSIYRRVADIQTAETLKLPVPKLKNGKYTICLTKPSEEQKLFIFDCGERAEEVHQKRVDPSKDNMLKITNDGKMCALDMRLVDPTVEDNPDSKVNMAVNNIFNKWEETKDDSLTQVVFLDRSTPSKGFNLYDDIKEKLIALGIPEEEIKFIHDAKNDKEKVKLFEDVNEGRVRILIGSTEKMGAGTNIQKKLCALHHIDVPWRPSDIEQREGRILRQGNDCKEVEIFRYATEGTFDSYSWQTIEYKQKFISQVMTNKPLGRSIDDVDEAALNYAEIKSLATGDPRIKRQLELSTQVDNLRREKAEFEADRMKAREEITFTIPTQIKRAEKFIEIFDNAVEYSKQYPRSENFCVEIVDNKITDREEAGKAVKALRKVGGEEPIDVCDYRGFKIQIQYSSLGGYGSFKTIVSHENATLFTSLGVSNTDVFDNIDNAIDVDMPQLLSIHKEELEIAQKNMQKSKEIAEREFPKLKEYQEKREELNKLTSEIGLNDNSGDMDIVFKQDAVTSVIDKSYIRDNSGTIIAKFTYSVPESYIEKIYNDDDNLSLEYGSLQEYVKSVQGDNRFYEKSKKARKIVDDDIPAVDDTMFLTLKQCRAIVLEEDSELLTLQGVKSNGEHIKVGTFDYDYQTYQTLSSVGKLYSEKLGIPFGDEDIAASRNRGI